MTDKKRRVEIFFDESEFAILEELSHVSKWSVAKIVYDTVYRAHFTDEAKKRHAAARRLLAMEPIDLGSDWSEMKEWMANHRAWEILKSYDQDKELS